MTETGKPPNLNFKAFKKNLSKKSRTKAMQLYPKWLRQNYLELGKETKRKKLLEKNQ